MIAKPSPNQNPLDPKLAVLADRELGERLRAEHPELFVQPQAAAPAGAFPVEEAEPASELGRVLAIIGMLLGLLASYALGSIMRAHWNDTDAPPLVSLAELTPQPAHHVVAGHRNLSPVAAQTILAVQERAAQSHEHAARAVVLPAAQPQHRVVALLRTQVKPRVETRPAFREQITTVHAPALLASAVTQTESAASTDDATSSATDAVGGDDASGRQMAHGPVWTENSPGSATPGGIVLGRGAPGGGGGMPGGCTRGR